MGVPAFTHNISRSCTTEGLLFWATKNPKRDGVRESRRSLANEEPMSALGLRLKETSMHPRATASHRIHNTVEVGSNGNRGTDDYKNAGRMERKFHQLCTTSRTLISGVVKGGGG